MKEIIKLIQNLYNITATYGKNSDTILGEILESNPRSAKEFNMLCQMMINESKIER